MTTSDLLNTIAQGAPITARLAREIVTHLHRLQAMEEALTPSGSTKGAYMGEFSFVETYFDEDGDEQSQEILVPWTTIKDIMKAITRRAGAHKQQEPRP